MRHRATALQVLGGSLVVVGVGFAIGWAIGSIVAGVLAIAFGIAEEI